MLSKKEEKKFYGVPLDVYPIDIHGMASTPKGSEIITTVSEKLQRDFTIATHKIRNKIFLKASRLYTSTPDNIVKYVRNIIEKDFNPPRWRYAVEAGSRFFKTEEEYRFLFKNIERRARFAQQPTYIPFPIESARAICRVLMYRRNGERGLHSDMANLFVKCASRRLRTGSEEAKLQHNIFSGYSSSCFTCFVTEKPIQHVLIRIQTKAFNHL